MNKAIFLFTMKRYLHWVNLLVGGVALTISVLLWGLALCVDSAVTKELVRSCLFGPMVAIVVSYTVISPQVANSQRRKDGEYLSLIFSRPISRWSYVVTKWLTGSVFVLAIMALQTTLSLAAAYILSVMWRGHPQNIVDGYAITDAILNAFGVTALVVFIASMPQRIAVFVFILYAYAVLFLTLLVGTASFVSLSLDHVSKTVTAFGQMLYSIFIVGMDSYHVINASDFPVASAVIYLSNIALYLTLATLIMSYREFFYAND
ncbi:MAG: hypothetical protein K2X93_16440 [Candidatus Obscuribacterales bacterium]|nr:hypothetical protein [Candidatus Obscuribacterales bacterium]